MPPAPPEEGLCIAVVRGEIGFLKGGINLRDSIGESLKEELLSLKLCIVWIKPLVLMSFAKSTLDFLKINIKE